MLTSNRHQVQETKTIIKTGTLVLIISYVIYNVNYKTSLPFNSFLHHFYGKDDGITRQAQSVCLLSALFYFVLATRRKILFLLLGLAIGLLCFILSLFIAFRLTDNTLFPHVMACVLFIGVYYFLPRKWMRDKSEINV